MTPSPRLLTSNNMIYTQQDITDIYAEFDRVHAVTPIILGAQLSPQTLPSIDAHKADLNTVIGSLEDLEAYFSGLKKDVTNARKKLERDYDDAKAKYWSSKNGFDRSPTA